MKENQYTTGARAEILQIKEVLQQSSINIDIVFIKELKVIIRP